MKKYASLLAFVIACYFISCMSKNEGGISATTQKNLDAMHGVTKCFDTKDFSKLGDYIAADGIDHSGEHGEIKGLDSLKAAFEKYSATIDNPKSEVIKELADDEYVMSWMKYTGTLKEASMGLKAGDKYELTALEVAKFKDGKATDHWTFMEPAEMMKMMPQQQMQPAMADTAKVAPKSKK